MNDYSARNGLITSEMVKQSMIMHTNRLTERTFDDINLESGHRESDKRLRVLSLQNTKETLIGVNGNSTS